MIDKIKGWVMTVLVKKYALGWLVDLFKKAQGYKTQISALGCIATYIMTLFGLDDKVAEALYAFFGGTGAFSGLDKMLRYKEDAKSVVDEARDKASQN